MPLSHTHLGLRHNPFGEPPLEDLPSLLVSPHIDHLDALLTDHAAHRVTLQLIGDCGRGKSASMRALYARHPDARWIYLSDFAPPPPLPWQWLSKPGAVLFVDESQRLSWLTRQRLFISRCNLVLGTHENHMHERFARWRGRHVHTHEVGGLDAPRLRAILERRIAWASNTPRHEPRTGLTISEELLEELLARHGDDLRAILDTTYELVQKMQAPGGIPLPSQHDLPYIPESRHLKRGETRHVHHPLENP